MLVLSAFLLGAVGKALLPHSSLRVIACAAAAVVATLIVYLGEWPSAIGLALVTSAALIGAGLGVAGAKLFHLLRRPRA